MDKGHGKYITDPNEWELPRLDDLALEVADELMAKAPPGSDPMQFGDDLLDYLLPRLRALAQITINETIEYWMKGLADGQDGEHPEFCVEFPYLERGEEVDALTMVYAVDNDDGTRSELLRTTLAAALVRCLEKDPPGEIPRRARVVAAELRALAERIDGSARVVS